MHKCTPPNTWQLISTLFCYPSLILQACALTTMQRIFHHFHGGFLKKHKKVRTKIWCTFLYLFRSDTLHIHCLRRTPHCVDHSSCNQAGLILLLSVQKQIQMLWKVLRQWNGEQEYSVDCWSMGKINRCKFPTLPFFPGMKRSPTHSTIWASCYHNSWSCLLLWKHALSRSQLIDPSVLATLTGSSRVLGKGLSMPSL